MKLVEQETAVGRFVIGSCTTTEDLSSIGNKDKEHEMEVLSQLLTLSEARTGAHAKSIDDLDNLPRSRQAMATYVDRLKKECSVFPSAEGATLLNCDGLALTQKVTQDVSRWSQSVRRFYSIEGHEVLFRPIVKCK